MMGNTENLYCFRFDVPKDKSITALEFAKKMNSFLEQIDEFNHSIVNGIDDTYTVASYIEDFETGSIKWWLIDKLNRVDDKAIEKFVDKPIKTTIAGILKISKKKALDYLSTNENPSIDEVRVEIIQPIQKQIEEKQKELEGRCLTIDIDERKMLNSLSVMSGISKDLQGKVHFIPDYAKQSEEIQVPQAFKSDLILQELETLEGYQEEKILQKTNEITDIYTVLTPTSKKDCKWELEDNGVKIKCHMQDDDFFNRYNTNQQKLGGNENLEILMRVDTFLEKGKIKKEYTILKVIKIIPNVNLFNYMDDSSN